MDFSAFCDPTELLALARLDLEKERLDQALFKLKQALAVSKVTPMPELHAELGRVYARLGLRDRAKAMFEQYLQTQPESVNERFQLGMVNFEDGDKQSAVALWEDVLKLAPVHPPALYHVALSSAQAGNLERAWDLCRLALDKIEATNLYFGQSKDLLQRIESDPMFKRVKGGGGTLLTPPDMSRSQH